MRLTLAVGISEADDLGSVFRRAGLVRAVANTVAEVCVAAVADNIAGLATELGGGNAEHVVDTGLLLGRQLQAGFCGRGGPLERRSTAHSIHGRTYTARGQVGEGLGHGGSAEGEKDH